MIQLWQTAFRVKHEAPNTGLWGDALTSATTGRVYTEPTNGKLFIT